MAQFDVLLTQNVAAAGIEFSEKNVNIAKGGLLSAIADGTPTVLAAGTDGYQLVRDDAEVTGLKWVAISGGHTQGTDLGTTSTVFEIDSDGYKIEITAESASILGIKVDGGATYADLKAKDLTLSGNLTVNGTTSTINSTTLQVDDKNIELGTVDTPTDTTADGGGITLKGSTDKTIIWDNANDNWTLNQNVNVPSTFVYKINNTEVLSATQVLGVTLGTMAAETATNYVAKSLFDANTILAADSDNTPAALTVGEQTIVGRVTSGNIDALTPAEVMGVLWVTAPAAKNSTGTANQIAKDANFFYICTATDTWKRSPIATNW